MISRWRWPMKMRCSWETDSEVTGNLLEDDRDIDSPSLQLSSITVDNRVNELAGSQVTLTGRYGVLELDTQSGEYRYLLDPDNAELQAISEGDALSERFDYVVTDGDKESTAPLIIQIQGVNDAPEASPGHGGDNGKECCRR